MIYLQAVVAILWLGLGAFDLFAGRDLGERLLGAGFMCGSVAFAMMARQNYMKSKH